MALLTGCSSAQWHVKNQHKRKVLDVVKSREQGGMQLTCTMALEGTYWGTQNTPFQQNEDLETY